MFFLKYQVESAAGMVRTLVLLCNVMMITLLFAAAGTTQAQSGNPPPTASNKTGPDLPVDQTLTYMGITLYGTIDIGLQYETHGAPFSDYHPAGSANIVQKNSRQSVFGATPSNMGQSRVGLQGDEPIAGDWRGIFKIETYFNPQSGELSDAEKSMVLNNGRALNQQGTNLDSNIAGQAFGTADVGFSHKTFGTLTFGRQLTLTADGVNKYDPNYASQAFSLVGMSGTYAAAGDTEDRRTDSSLKYYGRFKDLIHVGVLYKFNGSTGAANTEYQGMLGFDYAGFSLDAYGSKANSAISAAPLSAAQVQLLPALGYSVGNSLSATISDNTTWSVMSLYQWNDFKFFASWERIRYANPKNPIAAGFTDIGGYNLAFTNNAAFPNAKVLNVYWAGVRYTVLPHLDLTGAYYGYHQNSYGAGATAGCSTNVAGTCSGTFDAYSFDADYQLTKRFDAYAGAMYSGVHNGVANGYLYQRTNINPTIGLRFKF